MADDMVSKLGEAQGEAKWGTPMVRRRFSWLLFLKFLVFFCVNTGENRGCLRAFFGGEAKWSTCVKNIDFRSFEQIAIFEGLICGIWNLHGSRPVCKIAILSEKKKRKKMSNLTLLGCQNYYRFELMGSQNYYRFIFCDDFLVIFDTPIFEQLFFVTIFS